MKKYQRLTCTKCHRDIDKLVNTTHYTPDRCTITQGCEGRLSPVEYRSSAGIAVSPRAGITDWQQHCHTTDLTNEVGSAPVTNLPTHCTDRAPSVRPRGSGLIGLSTGSLGQVVVAARSTAPTITIELEGKADKPKAYRAYVFRREGAFSTVAGVESGLEKKALRFAAGDMVEVYLDGVKQEPGEDYSVADGSATSSAPPNTIAFSRLIDQPGVTQVDVIVSKDEPAASYSLVLRRNTQDESRRGKGAYENVDTVSAIINSDGWEEYSLYTVDLEEVGIPLNSILVPRDTDAMLLLARRPYTQLDRYSTLVIPLQSMNHEVDYLKFYAVDGVPALQATEESLLQIFPPLRFNKFAVERPVTTPVPGVQEQLVVDGKVIIGPDA